MDHSATNPTALRTAPQVNSPSGPTAGVPFIGSWSLVSWTITAADGCVEYPQGEDAWGRLLYLADGQMAASLMRRKRTRFASDQRGEATAAECEAAYREFLA